LDQTFIFLFDFGFFERGLLCTLFFSSAHKRGT
jgi:hypothetical protein